MHWGARCIPFSGAHDTYMTPCVMWYDTVCGSVIVWGRWDVVREVGVERKLGEERL